MNHNSSIRHLNVTLLMLTVALCASGAVHAQSLYGAGGLFLNPTADFPKKGQISPSALELQQRRAANSKQLTWTSYGVDYGLSDKMEVGATYLKINPKTPRFTDGSFGLYAKYRILEERRHKRPALAVGTSFASGGDANGRTAFAALRYTVTRPNAKHSLRLHAGMIYIDEMDGIRHRENAPYAGIDLGLTRKLTAFAETRSRLDSGDEGTLGTFTARALGVVWTPVDNYKLVVVYGTNGWTDAHSHLGVGIGYSIGGGR